MREQKKLAVASKNSSNVHFYFACRREYACQFMNTVRLPQDHYFLLLFRKEVHAMEQVGDYRTTWSLGFLLGLSVCDASI